MVNVSSDQCLATAVVSMIWCRALSPAACVAPLLAGPEGLGLCRLCGLCGQCGLRRQCGLCGQCGRCGQR